MIRFIHTADIHFGMENYGVIDPVMGIHTRLLDFSRALNHCIDYAINNQVDFFLFAGDAYKTTNPSPTQQRLLLKCFLRLHKAGIPLIIIVGNHDNPLSFGKAHSLDIFHELPLEGFHVIAKPTSLMLMTKSGPVQIVGIPWPTRTTIAISENHTFKNNSELTEYIAAKTGDIIAHFAQQLNPTLPAVLSAHLTVSTGIFSGSEKRAIYGTDPLFLPSQLAIPPFDYVGLGHLHRHQNLNPHGYPAVVYSGSIERIDFGERKEEKGFCDVTIHDKGNTTYEFVEVPTRRFIQLECRLNETSSQTEQILSVLKNHDLTDAIVKLLYYLPAGAKDTVELHKIEQACSKALDIAGIIPIHQLKQRSNRMNMNIDMNLETLLSSYLETKPTLIAKKERLLSKVQELVNDLEQQELHS
jgi:exonuclease SbcD